MFTWEGSSGCVPVVSFLGSFVSKEGNVKLQLAPGTLQSRVCVEVGQTNVLLPVYRTLTLEMSPGLGLRLGVRWEMGGEGGACSGSPVGSRTRQAGLQFQLHHCRRSLDLCEYPLLWLGKRATCNCFHEDS